MPIPEADWTDRLVGHHNSTVTSGGSAPAELAVAAARAASDKLATDIVILDVGDVLAITDYFVITAGSNDRQVRAIIEEVERHLGERHGVKPARVEGLDSLRWVLLDYGSFVVHVFDDETRQYYQLERLWKDVGRLEWSN